MRKLAAIMFTDIEGYTALMGEDESKALQILQKNRDLLKPLVEGHNGEWLKEMGDGTLSCFTSAVDAVNCAREIQLSLKDDPDLTLRIGIHIGDVVFESGDVFGDGVNVASRIEPLAEPGSICVSGRVYDDIHNKPDIETVYIGERSLKHVKRPIKVYALTGGGLPTPLGKVLAAESTKTGRIGITRRQLGFAGGVVVGIAVAIFGYLFLTGQRLEADEPIPIAVVDFINGTSEPELDGLSGMLITALEQSHRLSVLTRSRMFDILRQLGDGEVEHIDERLGKDIARHAQLDVLIIASIRKLGELYIIDLKALEPDRDEYLFTAQEEGDGQEHIPGMLDKLAERTRIGLKEKLEQVQATNLKVATLTTPNLDAYQHYFQGEESINKLRFEDAQREFKRAIALDSTFGLAYYRLAYAISWNIGIEQVAMIPIQKAFALMDRIPAKERYLVRAEKTKLEEGMAAGLTVLREMERTYPDDKEMMYNIGDWSYHIRDYQTTEEYLRKVLAIDPTFPRALQHLCWLYRDTGEYSRMRDAAQRYVDATHSEEASALLADALTLSGKPREGLALLEELSKKSSQPWTYLDAMAGINTLIGDYGQAETLLLRLIEEHQPPAANMRGYLQLAAFYPYLGRYRDAIRACDRYIEAAWMTKDTAWAATQQLHKAALLWNGWRDFENSRKEVQETLPYQHRVNSPYYWGYLILMYSADHEFALAESLIAEIFGDAGEHPAAASLYSVLASRRQDCDLAASYLETVMETTQGFMKIYTLGELAECQLQTSRYNQAIKSLKAMQSITDDPLNMTAGVYYPKSYYSLGRAYEGLGQSDSAMVYYEKFLELWKDADEDLIDLIDAKARYEKLKAASAS
ncbi:adenylate/guanylate cyclase domain-containing protein [Candidatus Neomarinimicrobiota bacterium]